MKGFVIGLLIGGLALGATLWLERRERASDPCLGRCGPGTRCAEGMCRSAAAAAIAPERSRNRSSRRRVARSSREGEAPLRQPRPGDLQMVTQGPSLRTTDRVDLAGGERPETELSTEEVTRRFRSLDERIVGCIEEARGEWDLSQGRVEVGLRIEPSGRVERVRISAPAVLQRAGLSRCIEPLVKSLSYAASARPVVMSFPYSLR